MTEYYDLGDGIVYGVMGGDAIMNEHRCCNKITFPNTFDKFAKDYGFKDDKEVYTNGSDLIPVSRVKQRLKHIEQKTGHWIVREDNTSFVKQLPRRWVECSHCGWSFSYDRIRDDYCSKCGARMESEDKE